MVATYSGIKIRKIKIKKNLLRKNFSITGERTMRTTALEYLAEIPHLRSLLQNLPSSLPTKSRHANPANPRDLRDVYSIFLSFQPDQEWLEATEDLPGSINKMFKLVFGWSTDHEKATAFVSRGKDVEAIADMLE